MNKTNYSRNAKLLDIEITDYDTRDELPTGINEDRMRLPERYDIAKFYQRFHAVNSYGKREQGRWVSKKEKDLPDFSDEFEWQITYKFPAVVRNPVTVNGKVYGGSNVTFRRLYLILCERFNDGRYFIDDYFDTVYPHTVKLEIDTELAKIKADLLDVADKELEGAVATKRGTLHKRLKANKGMQAKLEAYELFAQEWEDSEGSRLARIIKEDIINCMISGQLQAECVNHINDIDTTRERIQKGLDPYPVFVATEQLIRSLQLFVKIGNKGKWQTKQGILV